LSPGAARLAARYPRVWHVIEADGAGPWLRETGLLPAADLHGCGANRQGFGRVDLGSGRAAVLRPQQMPDRRLLPTLAGAFAGRPELWRRHVDRHVFFWTEARRRDAFTRACVRLRGTGGPPPVTLALGTAALLERHGEIAFFATINIGSTVRGGARTRRNENTLRPVAEYRSGPVAELAIRGRVELAGIDQCTTEGRGRRSLSIRRASSGRSAPR
jgi:hypothetical protein